MANRYWVGNGTNWSSTTSWSATDGGASGASVPISADTAYFTALSTGSTVVTVSSVCFDLIASGYTSTWSGAGQLSTYGNTIIMSSGMTSTWSGTYTPINTATTITSNGFLWNALIISTPAQTITLVDTMSITTYTHSSTGANNTINGANLIWRGTGAFTMSSGRFLSGSSTVVLGVLVSGSISIGGIYNNVNINGVGTIAQIGAVNIYSGTWTYTAGNWNTGTSAFAIFGSCALDLAGMNVYRLLPSAVATITLLSHLNVIADVNYSVATGPVFSGPAGFTCALLGTNASSTGRGITLGNGVEYFVNGSLDIIAGFRTNKSVIRSDVTGIPAKLTLSYNSVIESAACDIYDIDASNGKTLWTYYGNVSGSTNAYVLPHSPTVITNVF